MSKIKDLLYDKNDILVAFLILGIAAFVIFTRVNSIMAYPEKMISEQNSGGGGHIYADWPEGPGLYDDEPAEEEPAENDPEESPGTEPEIYSLYIAYGQSMAEIARNLVSLGLFESERDFHAHVEAHNAASKVKAGNFIIPADSTKDEVIKIITNNPR